MGAGILPTTIYKGKLYFLLGKENKYEKNEPGWSDFGGGTDNNESFLQTALREGSEELTGFLGDKNELRKILSKGTYDIDNERYKIFIFPLEYDPQLPYYYNKNHRFIENYLDKEIIKTTKIFEKSEIKWICIDDLNKMRSKLRCFFNNTVDKLLNERKEIYDFIKKRLSKNNKTRKNH